MDAVPASPAAPHRCKSDSQDGPAGPFGVQQLLPNRAEGSRVTWEEPRTRQVLRPMLPSEMWVFWLALKHAEFDKRVSGAPCAVSCGEPHGPRDNQGHSSDESPALGTLCESLFFTCWQVASNSKDFPAAIRLRKSGELAGASHTCVNSRAPSLAAGCS